MDSCSDTALRQLSKQASRPFRSDLSSISNAGVAPFRSNSCLDTRKSHVESNFAVFADAVSSASASAFAPVASVSESKNLFNNDARLARQIADRNQGRTQAQTPHKCSSISKHANWATDFSIKHSVLANETQNKSTVPLKSTLSAGRKWANSNYVSNAYALTQGADALSIQDNSVLYESGSRFLRPHQSSLRSVEIQCISVPVDPLENLIAQEFSRIESSLANQEQSRESTLKHKHVQPNKDALLQQSQKPPANYIEQQSVDPTERYDSRNVPDSLELCQASEQNANPSNPRDERLKKAAASVLTRIDDDDDDEIFKKSNFFSFLREIKSGKVSL